jgi:trimeric autotransporter adhesin
MRHSRSLTLRLAAVAAVAVALCGLAASGAADAQQRVGVSSAVNPQATGTPPGATTRPLIIGQSVVFNEHITTQADGQAQLLFVDESSMTVGPNSDLTIDQFVYDPKTGTGRLAMSATRGLLRYVGGALSKHEGAVTLRTSTATLAVRGGAFIVNITAGGKTDVIFIYGRSLTVAGVNGVLQTLSRPGFQVTITPTGGVSSPQRATARLLSTLTTQLDGRRGSSGGATTVPTDATVDQQTQQLNNTLSESLQNIINTTLGPQYINPTNFQQNYIITGSLLPSLPTTAITSTAITYSGQVKGTGNRTVGFATLSPPGSAGDFNGTVAYAAGTLTYTAGAPQSGVFGGTFGNFGSISFPLPLCSTSSSAGCSASFGPAGTSSPFGTFSGTSFMSADDGFFYATIVPTNNPNARLFVFGGAPVDPGFYQPTGNTRIFAFTVQPDAALQSNIPFVRAQAGGNLPNAAVSPLYIVAPPLTAIGDTSTLSAAHGLQASLAINGQGPNQQSAIAVTTGIVGAGSNGQPVFNGTLRGSSLISATGTPTAVQGTVSSTEDGKGVSFYGGNAISGVVLSQSPAGVTEVPLSGNSTAYGFAQPAMPANLPAGNSSRTTQALNGYFGGLMYTNAQPAPYAVAGNALIATDAPNNRVEAILAGGAQPSSSGGVSALTLRYGGGLGNAPIGHSAFIDDNNFAATESVADPQSITINGTTSQPTGPLYLVSSGATTQPANPTTGQAAVNPADALLPPGVSYCQCQYLKWGYWGGTLTTNDTNPPRIDAAHINTWVAGSLTPLADLQNLEAMSVTATYTGAAIGSVFNNGASYAAAGGFNGTYNFGTQSGTFAITNFDAHNFAASGGAPLIGANYSFGATANGFAGAVSGSFYGPKAAETGGNFAFRSTAGPTYIASGIFAGKR